MNGYHDAEGESNGIIERKSLNEQRRLFKEELDKHPSLEQDERVYLISAKWYKNWKDLVNFDKPEENVNEDNIENCNVTPIDNSLLFQNANEEGSSLKPDLKEDEDYCILPESNWKLLYKWYTGGPVIRRRVISEGENGKYKRVEVYLLTLKIYKANKDGNPGNSDTELDISRMQVFSRMKQTLCKNFNYPEKNSRIWDLDATPPQLISEKEDKTLQDLQIINGQKFLIETKLSDGA